MNDDLYFCPLVEMNIHNYECIENCDCIDGYIKISSCLMNIKEKRSSKKFVKNANITLIKIVIACE